VDSSSESDLTRYLEAAQVLVEDQYGGSKRKLAQDTTLSPSTVNRTLNPESTYQETTRLRNLRQILSELGHLEDLTSRFFGGGELTTDQERTVSLPRVSFRASAGDGAYVTEKEVADHYVIDSRELRQSGAPNGLFVIQIDGESMKPEFRPSEWLIMQSVEPDKLIRVDGVYLYRYQDMVQLKRLQRRGGRTLHVLPANDRYPNYTIDIDDGTDFELLGSVYARFERYS